MLRLLSLCLANCTALSGLLLNCSPSLTGMLVGSRAAVMQLEVPQKTLTQQKRETRECPVTNSRVGSSQVQMAHRH